MDYGELKYYDGVIDAIMERIGKKWTKSMIKRQLREWFPGISLNTCTFLIGRAKKKIRELYNIDPSEYKGSQISFYEFVIRSKSDLKHKLIAAERLDKLFGLEHVSIKDPSIIAEKIQQALKEMDESVLGSEDENGGNKNVGEGEIDAGNSTKEKQKNTVNSEIFEGSIIEESTVSNKEIDNDIIPEEIKKELSSFKIEEEKDDEEEK